MITDGGRSWIDSMPEAYDRWLGPVVFRPFAVDLARRAASLNPRRVLELAAGSGVLTRELVAGVPSAEVIATDLSTAMVELGSEKVPGATWQQADALRLPFPDERFDLVVCQFGVMFFPDKAAVFAEARRVLSPGGRLLFNTWGAVHTHDFGQALCDALEHTFADDPPRFLVTVPHGYTDLELIAADLSAGGLESVSIESVTLAGHADSAADVAVGFCTGTPVRLEIEARADLAATTAIIKDEMTARLGPGPVTGQMTAHVVDARRSI